MNENNRGKFATYLELSSRHLAISTQEITLNIKWTWDSPNAKGECDGLIVQYRLKR